MFASFLHEFFILCSNRACYPFLMSWLACCLATLRFASAGTPNMLPSLLCSRIVGLHNQISWHGEWGGSTATIWSMAKSGRPTPRFDVRRTHCKGRAQPQVSCESLDDCYEKGIMTPLTQSKRVAVCRHRDMPAPRVAGCRRVTSLHATCMLHCSYFLMQGPA